MNSSNETALCANTNDDIVLLGVVSVETKGNKRNGEITGEDFVGGISDQ